MTPAADLALATTMAHRHSSHCQRCLPPSVERATAGCPLGRDLERIWLRWWLAAVLALSSRGWAS